jgi:hypothetical protein
MKHESNSTKANNLVLATNFSLVSKYRPVLYIYGRIFFFKTYGDYFSLKGLLQSEG